MFMLISERSFAALAFAARNASRQAAIASAAASMEGMDRIRGVLVFHSRIGGPPH